MKQYRVTMTFVMPAKSADAALERADKKAPDVGKLGGEWRSYKITVEEAPDE